MLFGGCWFVVFGCVVCCFVLVVVIVGCGGLVVSICFLCSNVVGWW